ncbi:MAG: hypothetical protein ACOX4V_07475 [Anaerovoracaceae bacterium]|jgi:TRAP-type C4-dicarboxylate transport system substrate-binding protein
MKKKIIALLLVGLVILLTACSGSPDTNTPDTGDTSSGSSEYDFSDVSPMTFRVATALPSTHVQWTQFHEPFMKECEELSGGKITFETYTAGELIESGKEYDGLIGGIIDIAAPISHIYNPTIFPASDFTMLPLGSSDAVIGSKAWQAMLKSDVEVLPGKTYVEYEFYDRGLYPMAVNIAPDAVVATTGKEFSSLEAISKMRLRSGSSVHTIFFTKLGVNPISMPVFDMFDAMSRGALDGGAQFIADWPAYGFEELYKYAVTGVNLGHFASVWAMDLDKWNALPDVVKELFQDEGEKLIIPGAEYFLGLKEEVVEKTTETGTKFVDISELPADVQKKFSEAVAATWSDWISTKEAEGYPAKAVAKLWRDCIVDAGGTVPDSVNQLFE